MPGIYDERAWVELLNHPAHAINVPLPAAGGQLFTGPGLLLGWSVVSAATGGRSRWVDGAASTDTLVGVFTYNSTSQNSQWLGPNGVRVLNGLFLYGTQALGEGVAWVIPWYRLE